MARYDHDGTFYIKSMNEITLPADGAPYTVFAKIIPPHVIVERAWVSIWQFGEEISNRPWQKQEFFNTMGMANLHLADGADTWTTVGATDGSGATLADAQDHLNGFSGIHLPVSAWNMINEDDQGEDVDTGLQGNDAGLSRWYKDRMIFKNEGWMGMAHNAFMSGADKMRYYNHFTTGRDGVNVTGHQCSVDSFKYIALQSWTDSMIDYSDTQDAEEMLTGDSSGQLDRLATDAFYFYGEQGVSAEDASDADALSSSVGAQVSGAYAYDSDSRPMPSDQLRKWATTSWNMHSYDGATDLDSGLFTDAKLVTQAKVTLFCKIKKPIHRRVWTPG